MNMFMKVLMKVLMRANVGLLHSEAAADLKADGGEER